MVSLFLGSTMLFPCHAKQLRDWCPVRIDNKSMAVMLRSSSSPPSANYVILPSFTKHAKAAAVMLLVSEFRLCTVSDCVGVSVSISLQPELNFQTSTPRWMTPMETPGMPVIPWILSNRGSSSWSRSERGLDPTVEELSMPAGQELLIVSDSVLRSPTKKKSRVETIANNIKEVFVRLLLKYRF